MDKKVIKKVNLFFLVISLVTLGLSIFYNTAFIPSCMLMSALLFFGVCYYYGEENKKRMYVLFTLGVLLIIASLIYTFMRIL